MFIAMNRFQVIEGKEQQFVDIWKSRDSYLHEVPGFQSFNLLQGATVDGMTIFASHSVWIDRDSFENWTQSESFRKAHANAGSSPKDIYAGPPKLELFEAVL